MLRHVAQSNLTLFLVTLPTDGRTRFCWSAALFPLRSWCVLTKLLVSGLALELRVNKQNRCPGTWLHDSTTALCVSKTARNAMALPPPPQKKGNIRPGGGAASQRHPAAPCRRPWSAETRRARNCSQLPRYMLCPLTVQRQRPSSRCDSPILPLPPFVSSPVSAPHLHPTLIGNCFLPHHPEPSPLALAHRVSVARDGLLTPSC